MTPLIDVLLVLLVMMNLSTPLQTHKVPVDLPAGSDVVRSGPVHRLHIAADGALRWDGIAIDQAGLATRLARVAGGPQAQLLLAADAKARYLVFDRTLATIKRAGVTRLGFIGNERFADWD